MFVEFIKLKYPATKMCISHANSSAFPGGRLQRQ